MQVRVRTCVGGGVSSANGRRERGHGTRCEGCLAPTCSVACIACACNCCSVSCPTLKIEYKQPSRNEPATCIQHRATPREGVGGAIKGGLRPRTCHRPSTRVSGVRPVRSNTGTLLTLRCCASERVLDEEFISATSCCSIWRPRTRCAGDACRNLDACRRGRTKRIERSESGCTGYRQSTKQGRLGAQMSSAEGVFHSARDRERGQLRMCGWASVGEATVGHARMTRWCESRHTCRTSCTTCCGSSSSIHPSFVTLATSCTFAAATKC